MSTGEENRVTRFEFNYRGNCAVALFQTAGSNKSLYGEGDKTKETR